MSATTHFNLNKPAGTDAVDVSKLNENFDTIDTEMYKPPLTVNGNQPDANRDIEINSVPLADNLSSDQAQVNTGTYIVRSSGGEASIANGSAFLSVIRGNMVKTGYVPESLDMTVSPINPSSETAISATIDRDTWVEVVTTSGTTTFTYTTGWNLDPANYGITVSGTAAAGDQIVVEYVKENRGTIATATPTDFVSTGWNIFNYASGYARVCNYSEEYGYMIGGTYTSLQFAETLTGTRTSIVPISGLFTVPSDGYVFVTGGNATDTAIWLTWSDWTQQANGGTWQEYTSTTIDLSGAMANFSNGLMRVGTVYDEINLNTKRAYSRIERMVYSDENLAEVIDAGVPYDTDTDYIYAVRETPVTYTININGAYTASDHGTEYFIGTTIPVQATSIYGQDLRNKLIRDVVTISQQSLTDAQKAQVLDNIGAASKTVMEAANANLLSYINHQLYRKIKTYTNVTVPASGYVKIDSYSGLSLTQTDYIISMNVRGFTALSTYYPMSIVKGGSGTDIYFIGAQNTGITVTVEYFIWKGVAN